MKNWKTGGVAATVLDRQGIVRWRIADDNWKIRPTNQLIRAALERVKRGQDASGLTFDSAVSSDPVELPKPPAKRASPERMALIPGGSFVMGSGSGTNGDAPRHEIQPRK